MLMRQDQPATLLEIMTGLGDVLGLRVVLTHLTDCRGRLDTRGSRPVLLLDTDSSPAAQYSALLEAIALLLRGPAAAPGARRVRHLQLVDQLGDTAD